MKAIFYIAAAAAALLTPFAASAQFVGKEDMAVTAGKMKGQFWSPKPTKMTPYTAPNKPHWKLSEILAAHKGQSDWVQPIVRNKDQVGDYISMAPARRPSRKCGPTTGWSSSCGTVRSRCRSTAMSPSPPPRASS